MVLDTLGMKGLAGAFARGMRAGVFLIRNMAGQPSRDRHRRVHESLQCTKTGGAYDLYEPVGDPIRTVVAVCGLTLKGEREARLVNFCRALAASGVRVAAPALPAMKSFRFEESDLDVIIALIRELHEQQGSTVGLVGFSVGGGLALSAAAAEGARSAVDLAIVFGAHYDLGSVWRELLARHQGPPPTRDIDWEDYIWLRVISAYRRLPSLGMGDTEREEMSDLLASYCDLPMGKKKAFFERVMRPRRDLTELGLLDDAEIPERMSPRGMLGNLEAAVMIFHDPHDLLVPVDQARSIYGELKSRGPGARQRLLITPLLSHVNAKVSRRVADIFPLLGMMGELFRRHEGGNNG
jgi:pimeloyl-ACP methyl ester carboxylesterase